MTETNKIHGGFYAIPKAIFNSSEFAGLSIFARLLFGLMLDRYHLSERCGWVDTDGRNYFYFKIDEICSVLGCGTDKAVKTVRELCDRGVIEKKIAGLGKPAKFYINESKAVGITEVCDSENQKSGVPENRNQEFCETECNNKENNKTENNNTDFFTPSEDDVRELIDYEWLVQTENKDDVDSVVGIIGDTVRSSRKNFFIGAECVPSELVRERLLSLNSEHISYVLEALYSTKTPIRDIRAYMLKLLYNAPITMNLYYTAHYHSDMNNLVS